jgi:ribosome maturation factor RimP
MRVKMRAAEFIVQRSWELLSPIIEANGFELVEVEFVMERGHWILRLYVDREGGVNLDDCVQLSEEIGHILDVEDYVDRSYNLEVSSPGLNRPLRKEKDFQAHVGKRVKIVMKEPVEGRRNFKGILKGISDGQISLEADGEVFTLALSGVKKANVIFDFGKDNMRLK